MPRQLDGTLKEDEGKVVLLSISRRRENHAKKIVIPKYYSEKIGMQRAMRIREGGMKDALRSRLMKEEEMGEDVGRRME